jgi:hypothetical protein
MFFDHFKLTHRLDGLVHHGGDSAKGLPILCDMPFHRVQQFEMGRKKFFVTRENLVSEIACQ